MKEKLDQTPEPPIDEETNGSDKNSDVEPSTDVSIQQQFNELKREYLNDRSNSMNRLLVFICIVLVFFTVMIPIVTGIAAYLVYEKFESIQSQLQNRVNEASKHATEAEQHANAAAVSLKEIENHQTKLKEIVSKLTSKDFNNPHKVEIFKTTIADIQQNSDLSLENKAIIEAYRLQNAGEIPEAIEKWRSIANTAKGVNDDLVARAFFSIGYLHSEENENDQALSAYDQAIELMPDFADAYTGRGVAKSKLGDAEEAIADHDEAIRLKSDFAEAYINRGRAKRALKKYEESIADYDEAIRLNPNSAAAYTHRGVSKNALGQHQGAITDHNEAIRLNPNFVEAYINRGAAKRELGQMSAAEKDMQKALQLAKEQEEKPTVDGE
ncbi:MAG: tetratricopeptide repeat protein [Candidatus Poribacteria bacterium]|nr:tetratricopeptide repeat protein [Candidatus Poribacteria bacterium]